MIVSGISVPLLGLVDTAVMGHMDDSRYLAAVAAGAQLFAVLFISLNFLRMGTTGTTAQAFGAADDGALRHSLAGPTLLALLLALLVLLAQAPLREAGIRLLAPGAEVEPLVRGYYDIRIWSAPAVLVNFVIIGWLLGTQDARGPLAIILLTNAVNIVLDLYFVLALGMDVRGVALATVLGEASGLVLGAWLVRRRLAAHPASWRLAARGALSSWRRLTDINGNLFIRTLALILTFAFFTAQGARLGQLTLAANALLMNFFMLLSFALDGVAHAAEALTGRAIGARDRAGLDRLIRRARAWTFWFGLAFCAAWALAGPWLVDLLTGLPEVRATARQYLPWLVVMPLIAVWSFFYDGIYVGATRTREMRSVMLAAVLLVFLPAWYLSRDLGNHGLWLAFTLFIAARGIGMHLWYQRAVANRLPGS